MKQAKAVGKVVFVVVVILGLIASYVFLGYRVNVQAPTQADVSSTFQGPTDAPSVKGPTEPPPVR